MKKLIAKPIKLATPPAPDTYPGYCNHCGAPDDGEVKSDRNGVYECPNCGNDRVVNED